MLPYDKNNNYATSLSLTNLNTSTAATVTAIVYAEDGSQLPVLFTQFLPAGGHTAFMLTDPIPATQGARGMVEFSAGSGGAITGLGLRVDPRGGIASIPLLAR
jgi:hypothetical protein